MMCRARLVFLVLLVPLLLTGCGRVDRAPTAAAPSRSDLTASSLKGPATDFESHGNANFYPLAIANRWRYAGENSKTIISSGGRAEKHGNWTREAVLVRTEAINGREYVREEDELDDPSSPTSGPYHTIRWLRQDRDGLYEVGTAPPHAPPFGETRLLAYPLHSGATWVMTEYPHTTATVEGMDVLNTPAGRFPSWRIRIRNSGHLPQEESYVWYGRAGYLGLRTHLDVGKPDTSGHIEIVEDQAESLIGLQLASPSR